MQQGFRRARARLRRDTRRVAGQPRLRAFARSQVGGKHVRDPIERPIADGRQRMLDQRRDPVESELRREKRADRDFVGGVQHRRRAAARAQGCARELEARKPRAVGLLEVQLAQRRKIKSLDAGLDAVRIAERKCDRRAHVGISELREQRAVDVLDQRMNHALRMDDDLDHAFSGIEQPARFDDFQPLVHHGGRIDRNFAPHYPVRMRACLIGRHVVQALARDVAERPAGSRQHDAAHAGSRKITGKRARQRLEYRVVFAVDRQQGRAMRAHRLHEYGPAVTSASLFASKTRLPAFTAAKLARRPAMPTMAAITVSTSGKLEISSSARSPCNTVVALPWAASRPCSVSASRALPMTAYSGWKSRHCRYRRSTCRWARERDDVETIAMARDDVERVDAHAAGRAEDCELPRGAHMKISAASGNAAITPSMRSSKPP